MSNILPDSLQQRILRMILSRGESTVAQVLGAVGRYISATDAVRTGKQRVVADVARQRRSGSSTYSQSHLADLGRREMVRCSLRTLLRDGKLIRTARGVYALPPPRIYVPPPPQQVG